MIRRSDNFKTLGCDYVLQNHGAEWQFSEGILTARRLTDEATKGLRRPFQIVISTDRFCPLAILLIQLFCRLKELDCCRLRMKESQLSDFI